MDLSERKLGIVLLRVSLELVVIKRVGIAYVCMLEYMYYTYMYSRYITCIRKIARTYAQLTIGGPGWYGTRERNCPPFTIVQVNCTMFFCSVCIVLSQYTYFLRAHTPCYIIFYIMYTCITIL